jgi:hypothetical protein
VPVRLCPAILNCRGDTIGISPGCNRACGPNSNCWAKRTIAGSSDPADWLAAADTPLAYKVHDAGTAANGIKFEPLYQVHHQRYAVYWPLQATK